MDLSSELKKGKRGAIAKAISIIENDEKQFYLVEAKTSIKTKASRIVHKFFSISKTRSNQFLKYKDAVEKGPYKGTILALNKPEANKDIYPPNTIKHLTRYVNGEGSGRISRIGDTFYIFNPL